MRNTFTAALFEPIARVRDCEFLFFAFGLVIQRGVSEGGGNRIKDCFEESDQTGEFRRGHTIYQLMGGLAGISHLEVFPLQHTTLRTPA